MGRVERAFKAAATKKISRRQLREFKMPETTVPVSLRDAFLEDPFFRTGWDEMNSECREMRSFASKEGDNTLANMNRGWPWLPKQWMLPQLLQDFHLPEMKDSLMLGLQEEKDKMEVTLDTSGYKPDELKVEIKEGGIVRVEGKHEEKSEAGAVMVSRQFVKEYALPESSKPDGVESSLSKDGVLVITMPKPRKAINQDKSRSVPIAIK